MAEETQYKVSASFRIKGVEYGQSQVQALGNRFRMLGARIRGTQSAVGRMIRQVALIGGAYLGFTAMARAIGGMTRTAFGFNAELEKTRIGMASVLSAVEGISFEEALGPAQKVFEQLRGDAIKSAATTQEMFTIFQGILGPMRRAGASMEVVRELTNGTVAAASALNVDLPQAARDMTLMARGAAGMDTKLFAMLRSTGAIVETTEKWNRSLTGAQRVEKLREALAKFAPAADAYGKSWAGVTSSFKDIMQQMLGMAAGPAFEAIKKFLRNINERILANREGVESFMRRFGESLGATLERVFARANAGIDYVIDNWDEISKRIQNTAKIVKEVAPKLAIGAAGVSVGRQVVGGGLQAFGSLMPLITGMLANQGLAGVTAVGGAGAAGTAGGAAGIAAAAPAAGILAAALAVLAPLVTAITTNFRSFMGIVSNLTPLFATLWNAVASIATSIWNIAKPLLELVGSAMFAILGAQLTALVSAVTVAAHIIAYVFRGIEAAFKPVGEVISEFVRRLFKVIKAITGFVYVPPSSSSSAPKRAATAFDGIRKGVAPPSAESFLKERPKQKVVNDFRGSKIQVKQEFRQADPDRIAIQMMEDIHRQAEARTQSGFVPALSR